MQDGFERYADKIRCGLSSASPVDNSVQEWEPPIPFDIVNVPNFPIECLPGPVSAFVEGLSISTQTPVEMAGTLALGILSTAFQSKYRVKITPDWYEPLCLYTVAVAPPGERKSAVIAALIKPVREFEAERCDCEAVEIAQNRAERVLLEKSLQTAQNAATKGKGDFEAKRQEALDIAEQLANFKDQHPFRLLVDDTTPEKLTDMMEEQGGSITVASSEGSVFDSLNGKYDRTANFDIYLKGHAGDPLSVDRIGRKSNYISDPRLSMILTIQPAVLHGVMDNTSFRGRGLCGRFLFSICKSKVGRREVSPDPIPDSVREEYRQFVRGILSIQGNGTVYLSADADEERKVYQSRIEARLGDEWQDMRDWGGKLVGAMLRIAALIHLSDFPAEVPISKETVKAAIQITEFFGVHAEAAYQAMGADTDISEAKYIWSRLIKSEQIEMKKRDLFRLCRGRFKKAESMDAPLHILEEYGYLRMECVERDGVGRKASPIVKINPLALGLNGRNGQNGGAA